MTPRGIESGNAFIEAILVLAALALVLSAATERLSVTAQEKLCAVVRTIDTQKRAPGGPPPLNGGGTCGTTNPKISDATVETASPVTAGGTSRDWKEDPTVISIPAPLLIID